MTWHCINCGLYSPPSMAWPEWASWAAIREEYRVTVDPARLASYDLSLADVAKALSADNVITAVGRLEDHYKLYLVVSDTRLLSLSQIRERSCAPAKTESSMWMMWPR